MLPIEVMTERELDEFLEDKKDKPLELLTYTVRQQNSITRACVDMSEHIKESNGHVADLQTEQSCMRFEMQEVKMKQDNLVSRLWKELPGWGQVSIIVLLAGAISQIGIAVKLLV